VSSHFSSSLSFFTELGESKLEFKRSNSFL